ncbi:hypothetical protein CIK98_06190 [Prevotella sp. P2-180]|nr:hypothetical protein CIK98_06190 [Prevotella sp. P2-180]
MDKVISTFFTTDYESAHSEFTKIHKSENGSSIEVKRDCCGDFTKSFWIGKPCDFRVEFRSDYGWIQDGIAHFS